MNWTAAFLAFDAVMALCVIACLFGLGLRLPYPGWWWMPAWIAVAIIVGAIAGQIFR